MRIDLRKWGIAAVVSTVLVLAATAYAVLAAALPRREGEAAVTTLSAPVEMELDARAIPRIRATTLEDALRGQGFMHAQERFFQMDLARRSAAGELAELFGERALPLDRAQRRLEFRRRSAELAAALPARHAAWLAAYVDGVNAGLADLRARPPEYWIARSFPAPWTVEDSLLVVYSFYTMLSNNESYERGQAAMHAVLAESVYEFLTPSSSRFDRTLEHDLGDPTGGYTPRPIPPPSAVDLRTMPGLTPAEPATFIEPPLLGPASNQWAVDATRGAAGVAMLANDPHLPLRLPNVFYRCELYFGDRVARGVSIPGVPGILLGANDSLAWGATVSNFDQSDWVVVEPDGADPTRYKTPDGSEPYGNTVETLAARGDPAQQIELQSTRWGPVLDRDPVGHALALHAAWFAPSGVNLDILELMLARDVREGLRVLHQWAGPSLSWVLADAAGEIAWTVNGPLPKRMGFDGSRPESWADGTRGWDGKQEPPTLVGRSGGALFSANNRTLPADRALTFGRMWMRPLRALRIEELLRERRTFTEADFLAMQLDTRAGGYDEIRDVLLEVVPATETDAALVAARAHVLAWNGKADVEQTGFRILHLYYRALLERLLGPLLGPARAADPRFVYRWPLADEPVRRLLEEQPSHLLPAEFEDWPQMLRQILLDALATVAADDSRPGADATWGEVNALDVGHPLAGLPLIGRWLRLPAVQLPGSTLSLRVAAPTYGAVMRMAIAPTRPADGILQTAGGQSGHFLSKNFADLQSDWVDGTPTPFLAGPTVSRFTLIGSSR
jgi:penicillin amidase